MSRAPAPATDHAQAIAGGVLFGHPAGLFTLFFAEMWERFSYYGMRALLLFYMLKGFLHYGDHQAYAVYGSYAALTYMTPFFGGALADHLLGARRAVVFGGLLMAAGHLLMGVQNEFAFFLALGLLIAGNGFFKPNISTIVGELYPEHSPRRDSGFTLFYMGINLGAAMSPLLCGYIGETYGWHYGFGLATLGMLTGIAVFVTKPRVAQIVIALGALASAFALSWFRPGNAFATAFNLFVGVALIVAAAVAWVALDRGGLPATAGAPREPRKLEQRVAFGLLPAGTAVYAGTLLLVPVVALLVSGFAPLTARHTPVVLFSQRVIDSLRAAGGLAQVLSVVVEEVSKPAGLVLVATGVGALAYLVVQLVRLTEVPRQRLSVVLVLTFFSMLFWSFFEQAGSSINNFTDRNVDRVREQHVVAADQVGRTLQLSPTQEQVGLHNGEQLFTQRELEALRARHTDDPQFAIAWRVAPDNVGMGLAARGDEMPASMFQSTNPICILIFGLVFSALWSFLGTRGREPSTPFKFALGLLQLGLGFGAFWYGAQHADARGLVAVEWLLLGYLLHTTGELRLSPVGLSMVTRLSPPQLVSTVMGTWFLATAFSQYLAAIISQFTGIGESATGANTPQVPRSTLHLYGDVFGQVALAGLTSALICFLLAPWLKRWMHEEA